MTLISNGNSEGIQGRCDAKCHDAKGKNCSCICGGRFHGKGFETSQRELTDDLEEQIRRRAKEQGIEIKIPDSARQLSLFSNLKV